MPVRLKRLSLPQGTLLSSFIFIYRHQAVPNKRDGRPDHDLTPRRPPMLGWKRSEKVAATQLPGYILWAFKQSVAEIVCERSPLMQRRRFLKSMVTGPAAGFLHATSGAVTCAMAQRRSGAPPADPFHPSEPANSPIGEGKGIHPGRVVWVRDSDATSWDGTTGYWWDDSRTDRNVVDRMTSRLLQDLAGQKNDKQAWDALFRQFNETRKL